MSLISLHRKYSFVDYQNRVCSIAAFVTFLTICFATILPFVVIFKINGNKFSANNDVVIFEQPQVKFSYKYIVLAENSMESREEMILCSSFETLKQLDESSQKCSKVKFSEKDENFDGKVDEMTFTFNMHTLHHYGLKSISIVVFLDSRFNDQCSFRAPSAVIINKKSFANNFNDRQISIAGALQPTQNYPIVCPFFMRNVKSHFFFEKTDENRTKVEEFQPSKIRAVLERNPLHLNFQESSTDLGEVDSDKTSVVLKLRVGAMPIRHHKSFWMLVNELWINYLAIFVVTFCAANFLLNSMFENRWLAARKKHLLKKRE